ncbi:hypothetical protein ACFQ7B_33660 [Streptomyces erythrochromogenes]|uniref:hypothetical protein n=1 Tax=Streptomyces erythrochromogenes TaxID=285574 RepID=UPI0036749190
MQLAGSEYLVGVLVEGVDDGLVGGARLGRIGFSAGRCEFGDDLAGGGEVREAGFGLGEGGGEVRDLTAELVCPGRGLVLPEVKVHQEFGDVHAASPMVSRQAGVGVVRRRAMLAVEAQ